MQDKKRYKKLKEDADFLGRSYEYELIKYAIQSPSEKKQKIFDSLNYQYNMVRDILKNKNIDEPTLILVNTLITQGFKNIDRLNGIMVED
jgi:hypothetical protein